MRLNKTKGFMNAFILLLFFQMSWLAGEAQTRRAPEKDPCNEMSAIGVSQSFVNGQVVYTFTPANYVGNQGYVVSSITFDFGDGTTQTYTSFNNITHTYATTGVFSITQTTILVTRGGKKVVCRKGIRITVEKYCCVNFAPEPTKRYWISGWVKEAHPTEKTNYTNTYIELKFSGTNTGYPSVQFYTSGEIIEGWQRIVGDFTVPANATEMKLELVNTNQSIKSYFDDIRVNSFNGSMKSYVYDPETLWLTAELDDNNYATFYEYDQEGQLIRIKKETARGIMTIQESRSSNPKQN